MQLNSILNTEKISFNEFPLERLRGCTDLKVNTYAIFILTSEEVEILKKSSFGQFVDERVFCILSRGADERLQVIVERDFLTVQKKSQILEEQSYSQVFLKPFWEEYKDNLKENEFCVIELTKNEIEAVKKAFGVYTIFSEKSVYFILQKFKKSKEEPFYSFFAYEDKIIRETKDSLREKGFTQVSLR